jgi:hypothetical protein
MYIKTLFSPIKGECTSYSGVYVCNSCIYRLLCNPGYGFDPRAKTAGETFVLSMILQYSLADFASYLVGPEPSATVRDGFRPHLKRVSLGILRGLNVEASNGGNGWEAEPFDILVS